MSVGLRAMILEDNLADVESMLGELRLAGFEVNCQRVETKTDYLAHLCPEVELILAEYALPQLSALEAWELLRERRLDIPFIIVTTGVSEEAAVECMKQGISDYLLKDRLDRLGPAVTRALEEKKLRDTRRLAVEETQRRNRELTLLNQIVAASAANPEPESVLNTACRELALALGVPHAASFLFDDKRETATFVAEHAPPNWDRLIDRQVHVARSPVFAHLLSQKTPLVANKAPDDPRLESIRSHLEQSKTASLLVVPLTIGNKVAGGIGLRSVEPYAFTIQQVGLVWRVADQLSGAIARARLDKERRLLTTAIRQAAESVIITDTEGTIVYVNPGFEQITGYSRAEAIGQNPRMLKSDKHDQAFYHDLWTTLQAGKRWHGRFVNRRKDGTLCTVDSSITPVRDERGTIVSYVDVRRDVTHELQLEARYLQAQKMEAVGRLAGGIAHDFNNLLTAIKGYTGLLLNGLDTATGSTWLSTPHTEPETTPQTLDIESMRQDLQEIDRATDQAASLIRRLMAFSRKQVLQFQVLDLNQVVTDAAKMLRLLIGEDIQLITHLAPDLARIEADPGQMEQVITNLTVNARDAMPNGGRLTLDTQNVVLEKPDVENHPGLEPGAYVMLAMSDTGTGMDQEVLSHIFEPFFTTKEAGKGTGLGLATVHGIVTQSHGCIEVSSEPGSGTTFRIYLPCATAQAPTGNEGNLLGDLLRGQETILVVEDEEFVRDLTTRVLEQQGYTVLSASHPEDALRCSEQYEGTIHLLLTDVVMPGIGGVQLARLLSSARSGLKLMYVSGYTDEVLAHRGALDSAVPFLQKPFTARSLAQKVRQVLDTP